MQSRIECYVQKWTYSFYSVSIDDNYYIVFGKIPKTIPEFAKNVNKESGVYLLFLDFQPSFQDNILSLFSTGNFFNSLQYLKIKSTKLSNYIECPITMQENSIFQIRQTAILNEI